MAYLTDRASLKRALYRLVNADDADDDLIEHDDSTLEGVYLSLQQGAEAAQLYLVDAGVGDTWLTTTSSALSFTGSDPNRYYDLPDGAGADAAFLRIYGDQDLTGLRRSDGERWGRLISAEIRWRTRGNYYYTRGSASEGKARLYLSRGAAPPSDLFLDYIYRLPALADSTTVDFPEPDRPLIVAFAAVHAMEESWLPGGPEMESKLMRNLDRRKHDAWRRARRSRQPKQAQPAVMVGDHWF